MGEFDGIVSYRHPASYLASYCSEVNISWLDQKHKSPVGGRERKGQFEGVSPVSPGAVAPREPGMILLSISANDVELSKQQVNGLPRYVRLCSCCKEQ